MGPEILIELSKSFGLTTTMVITANVLSGIVNHIGLVRMDNSDFKIDALPPVICETRDINREFVTREIAVIIDEFINKLSSVPHIDLGNFYYNYAPYRFQEKDTSHSNKCGYNIKKNIIVLNPEEDLRTQLIPSLLDLASSQQTPKFDAVGLMRITKDNTDRIGHFLHTTYEAILASRYFDIKFASDYDFRIFTTLFVEQIVGRELMESAFFTGALDKLVEKLSTYASREDVIKMIRELDYIRQVINANSITSRLLSASTYRDAILKLSKMYITKIEREPSLNPVDLQKRLELLEDFILREYRYGFLRYTPTKKMVLEIRGYFSDKPNNLNSRGGL